MKNNIKAYIYITPSLVIINTEVNIVGCMSLESSLFCTAIRTLSRFLYQAKQYKQNKVCLYLIKIKHYRLKNPDQM